MVELVQFFPSGYSVAGFAPCRRPVRAFRSHAFAELPAMRILMTRRAGPIFIHILDGSRGAGACRNMALDAGNRDMRTGQPETGLLVARQGEQRRMESLHIVTLFAAILVRRGSKLPFVNIFVAILAGSLGDLKDRVLALGQMAHVAFDRCVLAIEWIGRIRVFLHAECGGFEPVHSMTRLTCSFVRQSKKLATVCVLMAIRAFCMRHCRLEISVRMTVGTGHGAMLS